MYEKKKKRTRIQVHIRTTLSKFLTCKIRNQSVIWKEHKVCKCCHSAVFVGLTTIKIFLPSKEEPISLGDTGYTMQKSLDVIREYFLPIKYSIMTSAILNLIPWPTGMTMAWKISQNIIHTPKLIIILFVSSRWTKLQEKVNLTMTCKWREENRGKYK